MRKTIAIIIALTVISLAVGKNIFDSLPPCTQLAWGGKRSVDDAATIRLMAQCAYSER